MTCLISVVARTRSQWNGTSHRFHGSATVYERNSGNALRAGESKPLTRERRQILIRRPIGLILISADDALQRLARFDPAGTAPIDEQHQFDVSIAALYLGDVGLPYRQALGQLPLRESGRLAQLYHRGPQGLVARVMDGDEHKSMFNP